MADHRGELVPPEVTARELRAEAGLRAHRAGYDVTKAGGMRPRKIQGVCNWGPHRLNVWRRDHLGRLIE